MPVPRGDLTRSAVLAALGTSGPLSRTDIARVLGVSPATVTQIVKDLLARGLVAEVEHRPSRGGRPAVLLGLVGSAGRALGAKVAADHVAVVDVRLDGQVRQSWEWPFDAMAADAPDRLVDLLRPLLAAGPEGDGENAAPLLGVGVCVPGAVDDQETGAVDAPTLGWQRLALGARLRAALPVPVLVENDVNALAVAERLYGRGRHHRNFLVVTIGRGVGAGLVVDGSVYRGTNGGAGEFGHFPVRPDGPRCSCGNSGCLEASVGQEALLRAAQRAGLTKAGATLADLQHLADSGSTTVRGIFSTAGGMFGRGVAGLINVMDPEIVIVLGEGTRAWDHWRPGFEPSLRAHLMPSRRGVPVVVESWDDTSWALGAAALVLATPYDAAGATGGQGELVRARLGGALAGELS
ncbi:ROK family transcriptional regulator [Jiangella ureilytica]|uniref:ROK family transcriptional regulator n=1 Tax=Jiangella ureilytica TaxID=2530374 RepID=A0A4R4RPS1_9ACTN|nr:ROK family transcriptional regulator [Jiangella ureilytica]TDC51857.1 ROK family transcriptional regulator [Jiangella ureilytica]